MFELFPVQPECRGVDAIAQSGGFGAVVEYMAEMRAALLAAYFHAFHAVAVVGARNDVFGQVGLPVARPSGQGIKFCGRIEQCIAAAYATIDALIVAVPICSGESRFGPALAAYPVLLPGKFLFPLGIRLFDRFVHGCLQNVAGIIRQP